MDTVISISMSFSGTTHVLNGEYIDITDFKIDPKYYAYLEEDLNNILVYYPHDDQDLLYYGANYLQYTIVKQDGSSHTIQLVGQAKNDTDTGYYIMMGGENYPIMKAEAPSYYVKIDGTIYDIQNREIYENLRDNANVFINQYKQMDKQ